MIFWLSVLCAVPAVVALLLTIANLFVWPRGSETGGESSSKSVSILIPARNEEASIEAAVRAALQAGPLEVVVYDDQSSDGTSEILAGLKDDPRLRVIDGDGLPTGWVGKPYACHRLAEAARGDVLLFVDADVVLQPGALSRLEGLFQNYGAEAVTAVPAQVFGTAFERLIVPLLHLTYTSWLFLPLVWRTSDPRFLAANGQVLAVRRHAYDAVGGFAAVRDAVVDDMALCRALKRSGHRVLFADGFRLARCRMYRSAADVWNGFSKNIFEGMGSTAGLVFVIALYVITFVVPWVLVAHGLLTGHVAPLAAVTLGANLAQRGLLAWRFRLPWSSVFTTPFAVLALCAIAVNSWRWDRRDAVQWAGRVYASRARRGSSGG